MKKETLIIFGILCLLILSMYTGAQQAPSNIDSNRLFARNLSHFIPALIGVIGFWVTRKIHEALPTEEAWKYLVLWLIICLAIFVTIFGVILNVFGANAPTDFLNYITNVYKP